MRRVLVAGATGLVGREVLRRLAADDSVAAVHVLARRALPQGGKLTTQVVDFAALSLSAPLPRIDEVYLALGTTIKVAGSQAAFRAVDFDANLAVARAARAAGARKLGLVSAMGADVRSSLFYSRVKGEIEEAVCGLGFDAVVIARPSLLTGDREALGQPVRGGEVLAMKWSRILRPLIPANYRSVRADGVARSLVEAVPLARGTRILLSGQMHG